MAVNSLALLSPHPVKSAFDVGCNLEECARRIRAILFGLEEQEAARTAAPT